MKVTVKLSEDEVREAIEAALRMRGWSPLLNGVRLAARHDPGDRPWEGPRSWVECEVDLDAPPRALDAGGEHG